MQEEERPSTTYSGQDDILLMNLGGDFYSHVLLIGDETYYSGDGRHWQPMRPGELAPIRVLYDPRLLLAHGRDPTETPPETIDGRAHRVLEMRLNLEALRTQIPQPPPRFRVTSLTFPVPTKPDGYALRRLGWEVLLVRDAVVPETGDRYVDWEMLKGNYHVSFHENYLAGTRPGGRPLPPDAERETASFTATVQGVGAMEPGVERELRAALQAYGADPELILRARTAVEDEDVWGSFGPWMAQALLRVWIDAESGLVRRMSWTLAEVGRNGKPQTFTVEFRDYGTAPVLRRPKDVMDAERAEILERMVDPSFDVLRKILEAYKSTQGRYPDDLTPKIVEQTLAQTGLTWPENPFRKAPARDMADTPGDFLYSREGDAYYLRVYGWDHPMGSTIRREPIPATP